MPRSAGAKGLPTNALLVSGPSKTADIQVTLAYGAHGPKELVVLLAGQRGRNDAMNSQHQEASRSMN
jgi:L-lactate utilization protein LutB